MPPTPLFPPPGRLKKLGLRALAAWRGADNMWSDAVWRRRERRAADLLAAGVPASGLTDYHLMNALEQAPAILRLALKAGANPNARETNNYNDALIHRAVRKSDLATVQALIAAGAELENRDGNGYTALLAACDSDFARSKPGTYGMADCARMLLKAGASPLAKTRHKRNALAMAHDAGLAIVLMDGGVELDSLDRQMQPAFHCAVEADDASEMRRWLAAYKRHGADINAPAADGMSLTHRILDAALAGNYGEARAYVHPRAFDAPGRHRVPSDQTVAVLDALRDAGGQVESLDGTGRNALHRCAPSWIAHVPALVWMIRHSHGAMLRQADSQGTVPEPHILDALNIIGEDIHPVLTALAEVDAARLEKSLRDDIGKQTPTVAQQPARRRLRL